MGSSPAVSKQGFFNNGPLIQAPQAVKTQSKLSCVDVGGDEDPGFRAAATTLIDNFIGNRRIKTDVLALLLNRHFSLYPQHRSSLVGLITPVERMQQLVKQVNMAELIQTLAYTLRQIAVDEMNAHPAYYRQAFLKAHEQVSPETMRKASTWIDESAIAALAYALDTPIILKVTKQGKELPMRLRYNEAGVNASMVIGLQGDRYLPYVAHPNAFSMVKSKLVRLTPPVVTNENDHTDAQILALITEDDKRLIAEFEGLQHRLNVMVDAGEINKIDLFGIYIKGLSTSEDPARRTHYVGTEHGTSAFFEALEQAKSGAKIVDVPAVTSPEKIVTNGLIQAISRAVSIGHMSTEEVFAQIDNKENFYRRAVV